MLFNSGNQNRRRIYKHANRLGKTSEHCEVRALLSADTVLAGCDAASDPTQQPELTEEPEFIETTEFTELLYLPVDLEYVVPDGSLPGDIWIETATNPDSEIDFEELAGLPYEDTPPEDGWDPNWAYRSLPVELSEYVPGDDTMTVYSDGNTEIEFFELGPESVEFSEPNEESPNLAVDEDVELFTDGETELAEMQNAEPEVLWMMLAAGESAPLNSEVIAPVNASEATNLMPPYPERTPMFVEVSKLRDNPAIQQTQLVESNANADDEQEAAPLRSTQPPTVRSTLPATPRKLAQSVNGSLMSSLSQPLKPLEAGFERSVEPQSLLFSSLDNESDENLSSI